MPWPIIIAAAAGAIAALVAACIRDESLKGARVIGAIVLFFAINYPAQKYIAKPLMVDQELQSGALVADVIGGDHVEPIPAGRNESRNLAQLDGVETAPTPASRAACISWRSLALTRRRTSGSTSIRIRPSR